MNVQIIYIVLCIIFPDRILRSQKFPMFLFQ